MALFNRRAVRDLETRVLELQTQLHQRAITLDNIFPGLDNGRDAHVTDNDALSIPAYLAAVRLRVAQLSGYPMKAYENGTELTEQPLLLVQPDVAEDRVDTITRLAISLALRGNAVAVLGFDDSGFVNQIRPVAVDKVQTKHYEDGSYTYIINKDEYDPSAIMHIRGSVLLPGEVWALSPVQATRNALGRAIEVSEFSRRFFADNATPSAVVKAKGPLGEGEPQAIKRAWMAAMKNRREPVVLSEAYEFDQITISPQDSQFIETEVKTLTDVANIAFVPGSFIGAERAGLTYGNIEQDAVHFLKFYLADDISRIERAFTKLLPEGIVAKFNTDSTLRTDTLTRYQAEEIALRNNILTNDEVRALENRPPIKSDKPDGINTQQLYAYVALVNAGFDPADAAKQLGLPVIDYVGAPGNTPTKETADV